MISIKSIITTALTLLAAVTAAVCPSSLCAQQQEAEGKHIKKVLFIGDSMTGWMAERLNAYGEKNGFDVSTVVWDGSTINKWADSGKTASIVKEHNPDAIFVSLGMNELFEPDPERKFTAPVERIVNSFGDTPYLWIGPPSWPGHDKGEKLTSWFGEKLGENHFFNSFGLSLPRQSRSNPHPSKAGIEKWIDAVAEWIPLNSDLEFKSLDNPGARKMSRPKTFIYKRMKENL